MAVIDTEPNRGTRIQLLKMLERSKTYDLLAVLPLIAWYGLCIQARIPAFRHAIAIANSGAIDGSAILNLIAQLATLVFMGTLIVLLIVRATPCAKAKGLVPRAAAIAGMYLSVGIITLSPVSETNQSHIIPTVLLVLGTLFALYSVLYLGRSLSMMSEARRLVVDGPYAVVRHPLYLGEGIALVGLTLQFFSVTALLILALQCACQVIRMNSEEEVLSRTFPDYSDYMAHTARLIPCVY